jgi:hypothetical protein
MPAAFMQNDHKQRKGKPKEGVPTTINKAFFPVM